MLDGLFVASIIGACVQFIKESRERIIPSENWANKELYYNDIVNGVSIEQRLKNVENGKYKSNESHQKPHRGKDGKIVIENCYLYEKDLEKYDSVQIMEWLNRGKYNLKQNELEEEYKRIQAHYDYLCSL